MQLAGFSLFFIVLSLNIFYPSRLAEIYGVSKLLACEVAIKSKQKHLRTFKKFLDLVLFTSKEKGLARTIIYTLHNIYCNIMCIRLCVIMVLKVVWYI